MSFKKTGDIKGNTESLIRNLKTINYPSQTSFKILTSGNPGIYLPIIHYSLFNYSPVVAKFLSDKHYDMFAKNDLDFINTAFHCLITLFNYKPELSTEQFFSNKFAEGKVILCKEIIDLVIQKNNQLLSNNKKRKGNNNNKNLNNNNNNNNVSPKFHELKNSKNNNTSKNNSSRKKNNNSSTSNNNSSFFDSSNNNNNINNTNSISTNENQNINQNQINNNDDFNNIIINNNNFNASLPMNSIPVPTPKPQYYISKNISNIQSSVQSFKPKQNNNNINNSENNSNQIDVYDSSQEYPLSGQNNNSSGNNSNNNSMDFNSVVKIITSLSESVSLMVNKIETFKGNIEDRLNKLEAEIVLIKNKQNYIESRLNNNMNNNASIENENSSKNANDINDNMMNMNNNINNYRDINNNENIIRNNRNINNMMGKDSNQINNNIYIQDSANEENNNYIKNNPIFTSFSPQIRANTASNNENQTSTNNKIYYNSDPRIYTNDTRFNRPYQEEKKVYNVFNYNQENESAINNINEKNKYADIDKLIENSEKNFFKTQKLLEDYEKK